MPTAPRLCSTASLRPYEAVGGPGRHHKALPVAGCNSAMCYSAQIKADYRKLVREFGAVVSLDEFAALYAEDPGKKRPKTPKAMDDAFATGTTAAERAIRAAIQGWNARDATAFERDLFTQKTRLVNAESALQTKITKKAENNVRVATNKIARPRASWPTCGALSTWEETRGFSPACTAP